jgi:hypothetical protein
MEALVRLQVPLARASWLVKVRQPNHQRSDPWPHAERMVQILVLEACQDAAGATAGLRWTRTLLTYLRRQLDEVDAYRPGPAGLGHHDPAPTPRVRGLAVRIHIDRELTAFFGGRNAGRVALWIKAAAVAVQRRPAGRPRGVCVAAGPAKVALRGKHRAGESSIGRNAHATYTRLPQGLAGDPPAALAAAAPRPATSPVYRHEHGTVRPHLSSGAARLPF